MSYRHILYMCLKNWTLIHNSSQRNKFVSLQSAAIFSFFSISFFFLFACSLPFWPFQNIPVWYILSLLTLVRCLIPFSATNPRSCLFCKWRIPDKADPIGSLLKTSFSPPGKKGGALSSDRICDRYPLDMFYLGPMRDKHFPPVVPDFSIYR